jgi:hypothetical protein
VQTTVVFLVAGVLLGVLGGCDAVKVRSGDSSPSEQSSGFEIEAEALNEANLYFESGSISEGEALSIELIDRQQGEPVARITHEGVEEGRKLVKTDFDALKPTSVTMECRNHGKVLYSRKTDLTPKGVATTHDDDDGEKDDPYTRQEPDSYHYSDNGETVIVGVDYEDDTSGQSAERSAAAVQFASGAKSLQCTHIYFTLDGVSPSFSPDGVLFSGKTDGLRFTEKELR